MWQQDYRIYNLSNKERIKYGLAGFVTGSLVLYFFYHTVCTVILGIPCAYLYCKWKRRELCKMRKDMLGQQFKDWIRVTSSGLQSGYSIENAFLKGGKELKLLYGEEDDIQKEIHNMEHLLANNVTLEKILWDFGQRSGMEDIQNFAEVFGAGKRMGGSLNEMIENCCSIIMMKADVEREISTLLHGRSMEQKIMCLAPFGIIFYIQITSPEYFTPLYHNIAGICIMTICLFLYLFSVMFSLRIVRIEV